MLGIAERPPALVRALRQIPPFHPVALRLIRLASTENSSLVEISNLIRSDAAFSGELLRLANSPLFGMTREVASILQAIALLGLQRVRALASTVALRQCLSHLADARASRLCWRHNLATALVAEELAAAAGLDRDTAYTSGLMHDLGRLALLITGPAEMERLIDEADRAGAGRDGPDLCELERRYFGADHGQAGAWITEQWDFPVLLREVARSHHGPLRTPFDNLTITQLACRAADGLGFQVAGPSQPWEWADCRDLLPASVTALLERGRDPLLELVAIRINALECTM